LAGHPLASALSARHRCPSLLPDKENLKEEVAAWQKVRNSKHAKADWHFTTADARVKLKRPYPTF
jgi:hypothetical protein